MSKLFDMPVQQQQSTQYYQATPPMRGVDPQGPLHAVNDGSLGSILMGSPILNIANRVRRSRRGTGNAEKAWLPQVKEIPPAQLLAAGVLIGALYYQAGKAMQPAGSHNWGWWGAFWGLVGGPLGIGIMGAVANNKKA